MQLFEIIGNLGKDAEYKKNQQGGEFVTFTVAVTKVIRNRETGEDVFRIPVADYALLVKGYYREKMGDQEYLDRQDEYTMTFFLDGGEWVSSVIYINSWKVVIDNTGLN